MYERSYGYRYDEPKEHASNADIAKMIRRDVKQAQEEGLLPARWSYSVRSDDLSIELEVRDCADAWQECDGGRECHDVWCAARNDPKYAHAAKPHNVLTEEAKVAKMTLARIHNAYNHDGSELMVDYFDVRYYGHVEFETAHSAAFRAEEKARLAARKAARESGEIVGKIANYNREGRATVHYIARTTEGKEVLACGARLWRGGLRGRVSDDAEVTCSRCAKKAR